MDPHLKWIVQSGKAGSRAGSWEYCGIMRSCIAGRIWWLFSPAGPAALAAVFWALLGFQESATDHLAQSLVCNGARLFSPTMVSVVLNMLFAAPTKVSVVATIVCVSLNVFFAILSMVSIVSTNVIVVRTPVFVTFTMFCANDTVFCAAVTLVPVVVKMFSGLETTVFVSHTKDSDTKTIVEGTKTIVEAGY